MLISHRVRDVDSCPGAVGRVWGVNGVTEYEPSLTTTNITVDRAPVCETATVLMASQHEYGHAHSAEDIVDGIEDVADAYEALKYSDRWNLEVEAWVRALEELDIKSLPAVRFHFILDCLNSYRRGLPADDEQWEEMLDLLVTYYEGPEEDIRDYEPLEPDPNEPPPQCGFPIDPEDWNPQPQGKEKEKEKGSKPNIDEPPPEYYGDPISNDEKRDLDWLDPRVLDEIRDGRDLNDVARDFHLRVDEAPVLVRVLAKEGK